MADHYADGTCRWWHLSQPSPELLAALGDGWLPGGGLTFRADLTFPDVAASSLA